MTTTASLLSTAWAPGLVVPALCVLALAVYGVRYRARLGKECFAFVAAALVFFLALASPIGVLARGVLFSAHMLQHLLLMLAVPPLVWMGIPRETGSSDVPRDRPVRAYAGSWALGVGAMWVWHERTLCNAAAESTWVQAVQTASLVGMGLAFWHPILSPRMADRAPPFAAILYLFAACIACTVLGVMITLSPVEVCSAYMHTWTMAGGSAAPPGAPGDPLGLLPVVRDRWGMSCHADQEIGGLLMWVPTCLVYASVILGRLGRYYAEEHAVAKGERSAS